MHVYFFTRISPVTGLRTESFIMAQTTLKVVLSKVVKMRKPVQQPTYFHTTCFFHF